MCLLFHLFQISLLDYLQPTMITLDQHILAFSGFQKKMPFCQTVPHLAYMQETSLKD